MISPPLADFLRSRRADCNARFAAARRLWPRLDAGDFSLFLRDQMSPLAAAVDASESYIVLDQAYDLGLRLVAEKLAGPAAISPAINSLWGDAFPTMAPLIATAPRKIIGSLSNAAHHLSTTPDARPEIWQRRLVELAPLCSNADELLTVAQTLAWRAGLAHYRVPALTSADALPQQLALAALEAPSGADWPEVRDAHLSDPWFGYPETDSRDRRVGAFRGFGGLFLTPPLVSLSASQILVRSGDEAWILVADAFGATFHRATPGEISGASPGLPPPSGFPFLPPGHKPTSGIIHGTTYAVTTAQSHSIWLGSTSSLR